MSRMTRCVESLFRHIPPALILATQLSLHLDSKTQADL
jgi:hypothetical protein